MLVGHFVGTDFHATGADLVFFSTKKNWWHSPAVAGLAEGDTSPGGLRLYEAVRKFFEDSMGTWCMWSRPQAGSVVSQICGNKAPPKHLKKR